jgi:hypothetical protein
MNVEWLVAVSATMDRIRHHSRAAFDAARVPEPLTVATASAFIAEQMHVLVTERREQALAVIALLPEVAFDCGAARLPPGSGRPDLR